MKEFAIISFLSVFFLLTVTVYAQIQYYGIDATLNEKGRSFVKLTITFENPEKDFGFNVLGRIENFNASSIAGPVSCKTEVSGITFVNCSLNLTKEKRTIYMYFETNDFVKALGNKFFFDADLSLNKDVEQAFISIKLPEGMAIAELAQGKLSYPENVTIISDGRHIIVVWKLARIKSNQPLRPQVLYEQLQIPFPFQLRLRYIAIFGLAVFGILAFAYLRYFRKPEKLILSVLDEFERRVMDVIIAAGGTIDQKKVVKQTNLSKAKVSRVVKSLVERGLIEAERIGRSNRLKLLKKKFKL